MPTTPKNADWAKQYATQDNRVNRVKPRRVIGFTNSRGVQNGLKIGKGVVIDNYTNSAQRKAIEKTICRWSPDFSQTGTQALINYVYNPSNRLTTTVYVVIEPDVSNADPTFNNVPTWLVRQAVKNPVTGRESPGRVIYSANLPDSYEFTSGDSLVRVEVTVSDTALGVGWIPQNKGANMKLITTWEPNVEISSSELNRLYSLCTVTEQTVNFKNSSA